MVQAYSLDRRERMAGAVRAGQPCCAVAKTSGVNVAYERARDRPSIAIRALS